MSRIVDHGIVEGRAEESLNKELDFRWWHLWKARGGKFK